MTEKLKEKKKIKYCQLYTTWARLSHVWMQHRASMKGEQGVPGFDILISGLFQWMKAFDGDTYMWYSPGKVKDLDGNKAYDLEEFDIIHVNLTGDGKDLPLRVRESLGYNSKTKLVCNIDYVMDIWKDVLNFSHPTELLHTLDVCDYIFAVEPNMARLLEKTLKREVPCIPHPVDVDVIRGFRIPYHQRRKRLAILLHEYDANYYLPHYAIKDLDIEKVALNATQEMMDKGNFLYNHMIPRGELSFEMLINPRIQLQTSGLVGGMVSESLLCYDTYSCLGFGRFPAECASLGVPCIGSVNSLAQKIVWPDITTGILDIGKQADLLEKLIEDKDFYTEVRKYADTEVEQFDLQSSKERMLNWFDGESFLDYKDEY